MKTQDYLLAIAIATIVQFPIFLVVGVDWAYIFLCVTVN